MLSENKQELYKMLTEAKRMKREVHDLFNDEIIKNNIRYYKHIPDIDDDLWEDFYRYIDNFFNVQKGFNVNTRIVRDIISNLSAQYYCDYTKSLYDVLLYIDIDIETEVEQLEFMVNHYKLDKYVESRMIDARESYDTIKKEHQIAKILNNALKDMFNLERKENISRIRESIQESKSNRINKRMDRTYGLTHIHASKHPLDLHAKKITPKRKNSIEQLENSVRRMF